MIKQLQGIVEDEASLLKDEFYSLNDLHGLLTRESSVDFLNIPSDSRLDRRFQWLEDHRPSYKDLLDTPQWTYKRDMINLRDDLTCQNCNNSRFLENHKNLKQGVLLENSVLLDLENLKAWRRYPSHFTDCPVVILYSDIDSFHGFEIHAIRNLIDIEENEYLKRYLSSDFYKECLLNAINIDKEKLKAKLAKEKIKIHNLEMAVTLGQMHFSWNWGFSQVYTEAERQVTSNILEFNWKLVSGLDVHHLEYKSNKYPWDYPDDELITLCRTCHKAVHGIK